MFRKESWKTATLYYADLGYEIAKFNRRTGYIATENRGHNANAT